MTQSRRKHRWQPWEEEFLRQHYATTMTADLAEALGIGHKSVQAKAIALGLRKSRQLLAEMTRRAISDPNHGSRAHQFAPGIVPANKGIKHGRGWAPGRMSEGQFQPGNKPHTWVPVGSLRIVVNKNGGPELQRKVNDDPGPAGVRWKPVARLVWEAAHGPVPQGSIVVFRRGMRTTEVAEITPDRLECITRQQLMQRNTIHQLPPEFSEVARLKAALAKAIAARQRKESRSAADAP